MTNQQEKTMKNKSNLLVSFFLTLFIFGGLIKPLNLKAAPKLDVACDLLQFQIHPEKVISFVQQKYTKEKAENPGLIHFVCSNSKNEYFFVHKMKKPDEVILQMDYVVKNPNGEKHRAVIYKPRYKLGYHLFYIDFRENQKPGTWTIDIQILGHGPVLGKGSFVYPTKKAE